MSGLPDKEVLRYRDFMNNTLKVYYTFITNNTVLKEEHTHDFWEIFMVLRGEACQHINGREVVMGQNRMMLIRPDDSHRFKVVKGKNSYLNLAVNPRLMEQLLYFLDTNPQSILLLPEPPVCSFRTAEFSGILGQLKQMDILTDNLYKKSLTLKMIVSQLVFHMLAEQNANAPDDTRPEWFKEFIMRLEREESFSCTIEELCAQTGYTPKMVNQMFRQHMNTTAKEYLIKKKLNYAANLLLNSDLDILTIAEMAGYHSLSHFIKTFTASYGQTPSRYRKSKSARL